MSGRAGRAGGGCGNLFDAMPELEAINPDGIPQGERQDQFQPKYEALVALNGRYNEALSGGPSMPTAAKDQLLRTIITEDVENAACPILQGLFDGRVVDVTDAEMNSMLKCILKGLMDDLDILRLIQMVAKITITVYYGEGWCRIGLAAAFVGSRVYLSWTTGISQVFSLGANGCMFVLSALSGCYQFINDPVTFMQEFVPLLGVTIPGFIGEFVKVLNDNVNNPAVFATLIAQSNVALMGIIYGEGEFQPYADLRAAAEDAGGLPAAAAAAGGAAAAAGAAAAPDAGAAAGAAPGGPLDLCGRMYAELVKGAAVSKRFAIQYFLKLIDGIRKIRYVLPGQLNRPEDRVYHRCCLFLTGSIQGLIDSLHDQADRAGLDLTELTTKILLDYLLPSKLRGLVAMGDEYNAKTEVYLLAHRIQSTVIDCINGLNNPRLTSELFVSCFPIFGSELTAQNVEHLVQSNPAYVLSRFNDLLARSLHQQRQDEEGMGEDSFASNVATVGPDSQPLSMRDSTVLDEFNKRVHIIGDVFATQEEINEALIWFRHNEGWIGRILSIPDRYISGNIKRALGCEIVQRFGNIASTELRRCANYFEQAARPMNTFNFPPIDRIWTDGVKWVLKFISTQTEENKTEHEIMELLRIKFGYQDMESFKDFFSLLMLRCKLSALLNPKHNTFDFFIKEEAAGAQGGRLILNIGSTTRSIGNTQRLESMVLLDVDVLSEPVKVPGTVTRMVRGASDILRSLWPMGGASCQVVDNGSSAINPPAAEIAESVQSNTELIQSMAAQDKIIGHAMAAAAPVSVDESVAAQISNGVGPAADAINVALVPEVLNELAEQQDGVEAAVATQQQQQQSAGPSSSVAGFMPNEPLGDEMANVPGYSINTNQQNVAAAADADNTPSGRDREEAVAAAIMERERDRSPSAHGGKSRRKSRKNSKKTTKRNKGRKSSNTAKKSQQQRARNSIRRRRSSRKGRK
jgi:hypothetical protein